MILGTYKKLIVRFESHGNMFPPFQTRSPF